MYQTIGFIGTGNMGSAVARAVARSGLAETILLSNRTPAKAEKLAAELPNSAQSSNEEIARSAPLRGFIAGPRAASWNKNSCPSNWAS